MIFVDDRNILDNFTINFCNIVSKYSKYIVVSGFFAISSGRSRGTEDIDIIISRLNKDDFYILHNDLLSNGFECIQSFDCNELYSYLNENLSIRYVLKGSDVPNMEFKFSKDDLDDYQIKTRTKYDLTGLDIYFSNVNVFLAFKEYFLKSPKDLEDAKHVRLVYSNLIDDIEIQNVVEMIRRYRL